MKKTNSRQDRKSTESTELFPWEVSWDSDNFKFPSLTHPRTKKIWHSGDPIRAIRFEEHLITFYLSGNRQVQLPSTEFLQAHLYNYYYGRKYPTQVITHLNFIFTKGREFHLTGWSAHEMGYSSETIFYKVNKLYDENPTLSEKAKYKRALNLMAYGDSFLGQMKSKDAINMYRKAMNLSDVAGVCAVKIGDIFFEQNEFKQAADAYHEGLSTYSNNPALWRQLGHCQLKLGCPKEAAELFKEAVKLDENDLANNWGAALAHAKLGNGLKTSIYLNKCVKLNASWEARIYQNPLLKQYYEPVK